MNNRFEITSHGADQLDGMIRLALEQYDRERKKSPCLPLLDMDAFARMLSEAVDARRVVVCTDCGELVGYMLLTELSQTGAKWKACSPVWGYAAKGERSYVLDSLLTVLLERTAKAEPTDYSFKIYTHDTEARDLYSMTGFGIECCGSVMPADKAIGLPQAVAVTYIECDKRFINRNRDELVELLMSLSAHLGTSPIFRPSTFAPELYLKLLLEANTRVFAACRGGEIIGVLLSLPLDDSLLLPGTTVGLADMFVRSDCRGEGVAKGLLRCVVKHLRSDDAGLFYVEHGTANPYARYFWHEYFTPYTYTMQRTITACSRNQ